MNKEQIEEIIKKFKENSPEEYNDVMKLTKPFYTFHKKIYMGKAKIHEEKYDLQNSELDVLSTLKFASKKSLYAKQISSRLLFSSGGLTKVLKKLELKKYILTIEGKFDKRKKLIKLTKKGEEIFDKAIKDVLLYEEKCFDRLNIKEKEQLEEILLKLID